MECERKNNHRKNETVSGKKPQCEEVVDVDLRRILKEAKDEQGRKIFETFSSNDVSFLVADWSRWDKYKKAPMETRFVGFCKRWMVASKFGTAAGTAGSWLEPNGKRVIDAVEDYLESCAQIIVDIEVVERLLRPENLEVSLRYVLMHATYRGSNMFQLFDTSEKPNHFVASRRRWLESQGGDDARQENGQNEWHDFEYQGGRAKAPPCPDSTSHTPLFFRKARRRPEKKKTIGS